MNKVLHYGLIVSFCLCCHCSNRQADSEPKERSQSLSVSEKYEQKKKAYEQDPSAENLIWFGRFAAYLGNYQEAIKLYTNGINRFPDDPRMLRHRGHRYISTRKFDEAIADLRLAAKLIEGQPDQIEPDGMPNDQNIPVSTLHTNIWYHLGLAYYLNRDFAAAEEAYEECRAAGNNDDNYVSATHWLYSIACRLHDTEHAKFRLDGISPEMNIIENHSYHQLCQFYLGEITETELLNMGHEASSASDAILYGLANWHFCGGNKTRAHELFVQITSGSNPASFGYIAAEVELESMLNNAGE